MQSRKSTWQWTCHVKTNWTIILLNNELTLIKLHHKAWVPKTNCISCINVPKTWNFHVFWLLNHAATAVNDSTFSSCWWQQTNHRTSFTTFNRHYCRHGRYSPCACPCCQVSLVSHCTVWLLDTVISSPVSFISFYSHSFLLSPTLPSTAFSMQPSTPHSLPVPCPSPLILFRSLTLVPSSTNLSKFLLLHPSPLLIPGGMCSKSNTFRMAATL